MIMSNLISLNEYLNISTDSTDSSKSLCLDNIATYDEDYYLGVVLDYLYSHNIDCGNYDGLEESAEILKANANKYPDIEEFHFWFDV